MSSRIFTSNWKIVGQRGEWYVQHMLFEEERQGPFKTRNEAKALKSQYDQDDGVAWAADGSQQYR